MWVIKRVDMLKYMLLHESRGKKLEDPRTILMAQTTASYKGYWSIRKHVLKLREDLRNMSFTARSFSSAGCRSCKRCAVLDNKPCAKPQEAIPSVESYGISVYDSLNRLGIKFEIAPRNYLINCGLVVWK